MATVLMLGLNPSRVMLVNKVMKPVALVGTMITIVMMAVAAASQSTAPRPAFEAASIKPTIDPHAPIGNFLTKPGGRLELIGCTLELIIRVAYQVESFQVLEGPRWIREDRFDLIAVPPPASQSSKFIPKDPKLPPPAEELEMLKTLLTERFQLTLHEEIKEGPVYYLVLSGRELQLSEAKDKDTRPIVTFGTTGHVEKPLYFEGRNASMELLATRIAGFLKRAVLDRTGLRGSYDFKVEFEQDPLLGASMSGAAEGLGLKLTTGKAPIRYLIIDRAERLVPEQR
jgi:uncharacterized protein (TIGR03435 family)